MSLEIRLDTSYNVTMNLKIWLDTSYKVMSLEIRLVTSYNVTMRLEIRSTYIYHSFPANQYISGV